MRINLVFIPKVDKLRGWNITQWENHWYATRYGVNMNTNSYNGIIRMILNRHY